MKHKEQSDLFSLHTPLRSIVAVVVIMVVAWIGLTISHYQQTKTQIRTLFQQDAEEMAATLVLGEQGMTKILNRLEKEQANRLLAIGFWLRDLEKLHSLSVNDLNQAATDTDVFNIVLFTTDGERELGLRGGAPGRNAPPWAGGRGLRGNRHHGPLIQDFLTSGASYKFEGMHMGGGMGGFRYSILVRRHNNGAIMLNIDAQDQDDLLDEYGPNALMNAFVSRDDVLYAERISNNEIIGFFGIDKNEVQTQGLPLFERTIQISDTDSLTIGFDNTPISENEKLLRQRLLLSIGVAIFLGIIVILWARMRKQHGKLAQVLKQIDSYHRTVLDTMEDAVIAWDEKDRLIFWNPKAENLFPELSQTDVETALPGRIKETHRQVTSSIGQTVLDLAEPHGETKRYRVEETVIPTPFPTSLLFFTDVTAVEEATREHDKREHIEALARVASGVAHEVRNPLNAIDMTIQTLCMEPTTLTDDDRETLQSLREEISRINTMVEHFLAYGRPQAPQFFETDLCGIIDDVAQLIEPAAQEKHITVHGQLEPVEPIHADAQQIKQALLNIILNAIEASPAGSTITLRTEKRENQTACLCTDQGCGMTEEQIAQIFDPYVTHKPGGTGLGMSIVKRIIETHNGQIRVESKINQGTTVTFLFPHTAKPTE